MEKKELIKTYNLMRETVRENVPKARKMAEELKKRGEKEKEPEVVAYANYILAECLFYGYKRDGIMNLASKALVVFRRTNNYVMQSRCYNMMGISCNNINENQLALDYFMKALDIAKASNTRIKKTPFYANIGIIFSEMGDNVNAKRYFMKNYKGLQHAKEISKADIYGACGNIADACYCLGEYDQALKYIQEAEEREGLVSNVDFLSYAAFNAKVYYAMNQGEQGNQFFDTTMTYSKNGVHSYEVHGDYMILADQLMDRQDLQRAWKIIQVLDKYTLEDGYLFEQLKMVKLKIRYFHLSHQEEKEMEEYRKYYKLSELRHKENSQNQIKVINEQIKLQKSIERYRREADKAEEIKLLSQRDGLTGLLNRQSLNQLMERYYNDAIGNDQTFGCLFLDLDCFKEYNDTYGHLSGDKCLRTVAELCLGTEDENCHFARYGGDEFLGVISGATDSELQMVAETIASKLTKMGIEHRNSKVKPLVTISVGLVNMKPDGKSNIIDYINFSDKALYCAKQNGKNQIRFYQKEVTEG